MPRNPLDPPTLVDLVRERLRDASAPESSRALIEYLEEPEPRPNVNYLAALDAVMASRLEERSLLDGAVNVSVSNAVAVFPYLVANTQPFNRDLLGNAQATTMIVTLDPASGPGRCAEGGHTATVANGLAFPTGGGWFRIRGMFNITTFNLIATTATPLLVACQVFGRVPYARR